MPRLLMIDPDFPKPKKSVNHQDSLPIGLLKIGSYYQAMGWDVVLHRLTESKEPPTGEFDEIKITSLYTYWSKYVIEASQWAREHFPNTPIEVGGGMGFSDATESHGTVRMRQSPYWRG